MADAPRAEDLLKVQGEPCLLACRQASKPMQFAPHPPPKADWCKAACPCQSLCP